MAESGALDEVTAIFSLLAALEGWSPPSSSKTFSLSGSMTGDGLPVAVELGQDDILITLVFCSSSSDCPTGYSCAGICYAAACPSAHPVRAVPSGCVGSARCPPFDCWLTCTRLHSASAVPIRLAVLQRLSHRLRNAGGGHVLPVVPQRLHGQRAGLLGVPLGLLQVGGPAPGAHNCMHAASTCTYPH